MKIFYYNMCLIILTKCYTLIIYYYIFVYTALAAARKCQI